MKNIFLLAGRTGGPFFPLPTIAQNLPEYNPIFIGVRNSFEQKVCTQNNWKLEFLSEVKLGILSFKNQTFLEKIANLFLTFLDVFRLIFSFFKSIFLLLKYKPKLIISTGSFLAVPIIFSSKITNFLRLTNSKILIHQQDPLPGLANRVTVKFADLVSCVFDYTKSHFKNFSKALLTPNPIDEKKYNQTENELHQILQKSNFELYNFLQEKTDKPTLFIFGGGSGAEAINKWTIDNLESLLVKFKIIHLTGILQTEQFKIKRENYFQTKVFVAEMVPILSLSDLVICRAGLASISELEYLNKPAFLIPLPDSHQELNAELVKDKFYILEQKNSQNWLSQIQANYPKAFLNNKFKSSTQIHKNLENYYQKIKDILDK
jgi:UDP-N-acetylglucosamine--N-acetylmuramyl-(pentapeptide) pyrophosphoryl-undecaprenol N-acetylglucosamine transferase